MRQNRSISLTCDNCGAKIGPAGPDNIARCEYCGRQVEVRRTLPPQAPSPEPVRPPVTLPQERVAAGRSASSSKGVLIILGILLLSGAALPLLIVASRSGSGGGISLGGEKLLYDTSWSAPPLIAEIEGKEHLIARIRRIPGDDQLMVAVFESSTVKERWRTPPLGTYLQAYQSSPFAVAAGKLLVGDFKNVVHVHDLASGQELKAHPVTDRVQQICPLPESAKVWIQVVDEHHLIFDLEQLQGEPGQRPKHCLKNHWMAAHRSPEITAPIPRVARFKAEQRFEEGELAVVSGVKHPGTAVPMAVGFDPESRVVRWRRPLPTVDLTTVRDGAAKGALAGGRYVAVYGVGSDLWRVIAIDARSGDTLWDVALRDIFAVDRVNSLRVTERFVYLVRTSSLEVLAAASGELLGTVGRETYE